MKIQGFRGNCDSKGKLGMCPSLAEPDSGGIPRRTSLRENGLQRPAKGGSTPAFACQHAAIAPLPCLNLQLISQKKVNCKLDSFKKCNCSRKNKSQKSNLLRKCGLLAHTSPAFLKNCWIKKLLFTCGSSYCNQHQNDFHSYNLYKFPHKNEKSPPKRKTVRGKPTVFLMEEIIQCNGADYEARTRYLHLGKVALYQMS